MMTTGQRIQNARKRAKLTQKQLGEKLGVSYQSIAQWENDLRNPKIQTLRRIAEALNIAVDELSPTIEELFPTEFFMTEELIENTGSNYRREIYKIMSKFNDKDDVDILGEIWEFVKKKYEQSQKRSGNNN